MLNLIFMSVVALTAPLQTAAAEDMEQCVTIMKSHCCNMHNKTRIFDNDLKECMLMPYIPGSCDRALCYGTKKGYATADGNIKMDKFQKNLKDIFSGYDDLLEVIQNECIIGGYTSYGESDDCELNKMEYCIRWQVTFRCPDFKDDGPCKGSKDMSETCLNMYT